MTNFGKNPNKINYIYVLTPRGITEKTISEYAKCGVDYISMGALTHSISNFDLSLKAF